jgi:hypothetical protein
MKRSYWIALGIVTLISVVVELALPADPAHAHWWDGIPAFYAGFGLAGCILLVLVAKALGKWFLQRREDYYDAP